MITQPALIDKLLRHMEKTAVHFLRYRRRPLRSEGAPGGRTGRLAPDPGEHRIAADRPFAGRVCPWRMLNRSEKDEEGLAGGKRRETSRRPGWRFAGASRVTKGGVEGALRDT